MSRYLSIDLKTPAGKMEQELEERFSKFGKLDSVVVKKSYNNEYSFAFIEFKEGEDASNAVQEYSISHLGWIVPVCVVRRWRLNCKIMPEDVKEAIRNKTQEVRPVLLVESQVIMLATVSRTTGVFHLIFQPGMIAGVSLRAGTSIRRARAAKRRNIIVTPAARVIVEGEEVLFGLMQIRRSQRRWRRRRNTRREDTATRIHPDPDPHHWPLIKSSSKKRKSRRRVRVKGEGKKVRVKEWSVRGYQVYLEWHKFLSLQVGCPSGKASFRRVSSSRQHKFFMSCPLLYSYC